MTKKEIKLLNSIKRLLMEDTRKVAKDKMYRLGYRTGFNTARRKIRMLLLPDLFLTKK